MPGTLSPARDPETRAQIITDLVSGVGTNEVSRRYAVSKHTVRALRLESGLVEPAISPAEPIDLKTDDATYFVELLGRYMTGAIVNMEHLTENLTELLTDEGAAKRFGVDDVAAYSLQLHSALRDTVTQLAALVRLPGAGASSEAPGHGDCSECEPGAAGGRRLE